MNESRCQYLLPGVVFFCILGFRCSSQVTNTHSEKERLALVSKIDLPNVRGRIDHMAYDSLNHRVFIAALGNNTIEVVDISTNHWLKTIPGLREPQGVCYIPSLKKLIVAHGDNGDCIFFDATTYNQLGVVHLKNDADNIRYDAISQMIYVGYGNGAIAVIDANSMKQTGNIPLDGHPESFQLFKNQGRIFINVPDGDEMEVADLATNKIISKWKNTGASSNFPMTLDEKNERMFIACRSPAKLRMVDLTTGKDISVVNCSGDADDVFYSQQDSLVFVSAGKGFIDVFRAEADGLTQINHIKTSGGARTSLLLVFERKYLLAVPAHAGSPAALWIYNLN